MVDDTTEASGGHKAQRALKRIKNLGSTTLPHTQPVLCQCASVLETLLLSFTYVCVFLLDSKKHEGRA